MSCDFDIQAMLAVSGAFLAKVHCFYIDFNHLQPTLHIPTHIIYVRCKQLNTAQPTNNNLSAYE